MRPLDTPLPPFFSMQEYRPDYNKKHTHHHQNGSLHTLVFIGGNVAVHFFHSASLTFGVQTGNCNRDCKKYIPTSFREAYVTVSRCRVIPANCTLVATTHTQTHRLQHTHTQMQAGKHNVCSVNKVQLTNGAFLSRTVCDHLWENVTRQSQRTVLRTHCLFSQPQIFKKAKPLTTS